MSEHKPTSEQVERAKLWDAANRDNYIREVYGAGLSYCEYDRLKMLAAYAEEVQREALEISGAGIANSNVAKKVESPDSLSVTPRATNADDPETWRGIEETYDKVPATNSPRCPVCLSDSRRHGNMRPCEHPWHSERAVGEFPQALATGEGISCVKCQSNDVYITSGRITG